MRDVHYRSSSMFLPIVLALLTIVNTLGSGGDDCYATTDGGQCLTNRNEMMWLLLIARASVIRDLSSTPFPVTRGLLSYCNEPAAVYNSR